jgi:hypothetical protein
MTLLVILVVRLIAIVLILSGSLLDKRTLHRKAHVLIALKVHQVPLILPLLIYMSSIVKLID